MLDVDQAHAQGTVPRSRTSLAGVLGLTAVSVGGAVIAVREGLSPTVLEALGSDGHLSVPLPMSALQVAAALAAGSSRRSFALVGSGTLALACFVAFASGFFDGGYTDDRLATGPRAYQLVLVGCLATVGVVAAARFVRVLRAR